MKHRSLGLALAAIMAGASVPAAATAAQAQTLFPSDCIDATLASNVTTKWVGVGMVTVSTKDRRTPCTETRVILSVYLIPDTWDGAGYNQSAFPQDLVSTTSSIVLSAQEATLEVDPVDRFKNAQYDVYFAPHVIAPTWTSAHGYQLIAAWFQHAATITPG